jgi:uncharacterized membrane protein YkvA (DUF1232 family)
VGIDTWIWISLALITGTLLALAMLAAFVWWRYTTSDEKRLVRRITKLRFGDKLSLAGALFRDPRVSVLPSVIAVALVLYLAMPLDIIPDFIPVLGYLDDVLIVVIGAGLLLRSIPPKVLDEHVSRFEATAAGPDGTGRQKPHRESPSRG